MSSATFLASATSSDMTPRPRRPLTSAAIKPRSTDISTIDASAKTCAARPIRPKMIARARIAICSVCRTDGRAAGKASAIVLSGTRLLAEGLRGLAASFCATAPFRRAGLGLDGVVGIANSSVDSSWAVRCGEKKTETKTHFSNSGPPRSSSATPPAPHLSRAGPNDVKNVRPTCASQPTEGVSPTGTPIGVSNPRLLREDCFARSSAMTSRRICDAVHSALLQHPSNRWRESRNSLVRLHDARTVARVGTVVGALGRSFLMGPLGFEPRTYGL